MSKRPHADVCSPRSDSDAEELRSYAAHSGIEPALPALRPASVDSVNSVSFGDSQPLNLPIPEQEEQTSKRHHSGAGVSPTTVSHAVVTPRVEPLCPPLPAIPEQDEYEAGHAACRAPSPPLDVPPAISVMSSTDAAFVAPASTAAELLYRPAAQCRDDGSPEAAAALSAGGAREGKRTKRRNTEAESPDRFRSRARAASSGDDSHGDEGETAAAGFAVDAIVLPAVGGGRFGAHELDCAPSAGADVPLFPLRPPSVAGLGELLRFGAEPVQTDLPLPAQDSPTGSPRLDS